MKSSKDRRPPNFGRMPGETLKEYRNRCTMQTFGARLSELIGKLADTPMTDLARSVGSADSTLRAWVNGTRFPENCFLRRLCYITGATPGYFITGNPDELRHAEALLEEARRELGNLTARYGAAGAGSGNPELLARLNTLLEEIQILELDVSMIRKELAQQDTEALLRRMRLAGVPEEVIASALQEMLDAWPKQKTKSLASHNAP
jgi:transcriptional regulator with XRE-family HTH domain